MFAYAWACYDCDWTIWQHRALGGNTAGCSWKVIHWFAELEKWRLYSMKQNLIKKLGEACKRKESEGRWGDEEHQRERSGKNEGDRREAGGSARVGGSHQHSVNSLHMPRAWGEFPNLWDCLCMQILSTVLYRFVLYTTVLHWLLNFVLDKERAKVLI